MKDLRELLRELPPGSRIERRAGQGRGHPVVFLPDGELLRDRGGRPVFVSLTAGDRSRGRKNDVAVIRRALRAREETT